MIQSVQRAAQILGVLGSGTPRLGVTEIAERVGLAKPTVHGLLRTLEADDLVAQDPDTGKYSLGPGVLQLGNAYLDGSELRARSLRWAESLAQRASEAVWVATLSGSRVIVLHHVFRPDNVVQILEVGAAIPWHACAPGHAIVAYLPAAQRTPALARDGVGAGAIGGVGAADRLLAPGTRDDLVRLVLEAARAVSRDLGAGRGGGVLSALG